MEGSLAGTVSSDLPFGRLEPAPLLCCCDFRGSELFSSGFTCCIFFVVLHLAFLSGLLPSLLGQVQQKLCRKEGKILIQ